MLRETAIIVRQGPFLTRPFSQGIVRISKFFREIMNEISKLIFSVMSYMVGDFNNSRVSKNTFLESSYKAFDQPRIHDKIRLNQIYFRKGFLYRIGNNNR